MTANRRLLIVVAANVTAIVFLVFCGKSAEALSVNDYVAQLAPMSIASSGQMAVPGSVLGAMGGGQLDPTLQFVLMNSMLNQATKKAMNSFPGRRESYQAAAVKFQYSLCLIKAAFQQAMLLSLLPQLSGTGGTGGSGAALAAVFSKNEGCDGSQNGQIDPKLLQSFGSGSSSTGSTAGASGFR